MGDGVRPWSATAAALGGALCVVGCDIARPVALPDTAKGSWGTRERAAVGWWLPIRTGGFNKDGGQTRTGGSEVNCAQQNAKESQACLIKPLRITTQSRLGLKISPVVVGATSSPLPPSTCCSCYTTPPDPLAANSFARFANCSNIPMA